VQDEPGDREAEPDQPEKFAVGRVRTVRLLPRINLKREVWPGGPQVGEVLEKQLTPPPRLSSSAQPASPAAQTTTDDSVNLLLLLR
jgi:hypothetical protein